MKAQDHSPVGAGRYCCRFGKSTDPLASNVGFPTLRICACMRACEGGLFATLPVPNLHSKLNVDESCSFLLMLNSISHVGVPRSKHKDRRQTNKRIKNPVHLGVFAGLSDVQGSPVSTHSKSIGKRGPAVHGDYGASWMHPARALSPCDICSALFIVNPCARTHGRTHTDTFSQGYDQ